MRPLLLAAVLLIAAGCPGCTRIIGNPCDSPAACQGNYFCDTTLPGGYCTRPCQKFGERDPCSFSVEQGDGVCVLPIDGGFECAAVCDRSDPKSCRDGYVCTPQPKNVLVDLGACLPAKP